MRHFSPAALLLGILILLTALVAGHQVDATKNEPAAPTNEPLVARLITVVKDTINGKHAQERLEQRQKDDIEAGVVRLTDDNYDELVTNGDKDILWVVLIHEDGPSGPSRPFYDAHTASTKLYTEQAHKNGTAMREASGRKVIFARMAYRSEWKQCTRWLIFRPPILALITDAGETLRFRSPRAAPPIAELWTQFFASGEWEAQKPWASPWKAGGERAWIIEKYIRFYEITTPITAPVPSIVWLFLSGIVAKVLMDLFFPGQSVESQIMGRPAGARAGGAGARPARAGVLAGKVRAGGAGGGTKKDQ